MELFNAIAKMDQGGTVDGLLQASMVVDDVMLFLQIYTNISIKL